MPKNRGLVDHVMLRIETDRLVLRPMQIEDVDDLYQYQSNPEIVRFIPWPPRTMEQVKEAAEKTIATGKFELLEDKDYIVLVWELKSTGQVIGQSNMALVSKDNKCADIGWVTHQNYQRQGYAFEATKALLNYAFANTDVHRVIADIDTRVPESAALAEKLGMRREATYLDGEFFKGQWCDMWQYAILKREFLI
jgi:RimJ/RimL family protein N-acetyltransferase